MSKVGSRVQNLTKSRERVKKYGEVYTPEWVVKKMCDALPEEAWDSIDRTFLEPSCGNGNFLVEILRRKLELCYTPDDGLKALKSITAIDILPDNCEESRKRLLDMYHEKFSEADIEYLLDARRILNERIICGNSLEIMKKWAEEVTK